MPKNFREKIAGVGVAVAATLGLSVPTGRQEAALPPAQTPQSLVTTDTGFNSPRAPVVDAPLQAPAAEKGYPGRPVDKKYVQLRTDLWQEKKKTLKNGDALLLNESMIFALEVTGRGRKIILSPHRNHDLEELRHRLETSLKENNMDDMWCVGHGANLALVATKRHTPKRVMELFERAEVVSHSDVPFLESYIKRMLENPSPTRA